MEMESVMAQPIFVFTRLSLLGSLLADIHDLILTALGDADLVLTAGRSSSPVYEMIFCALYL